MTVLVMMILLGSDGAPGSRLEGDVVLRLERDWDGRRSDGTYREDRNRLRGRLRIAWTADLNRRWRFGTRLRSGSPEREQAPFVDLDEGRDALRAHLDRYFVRATSRDGRSAIWLGKNRHPFWWQSEFAWDADVNPEGLALTHEGDIRWALGYFLLDDPNRDTDFGDRARLWAGQARLRRTHGAMTWNGALGYLGARDRDGIENPVVSDLDYDILSGSVMAALDARELRFGLELIENLSGSAENRHNGDARTGYSTLIDWGRADRPGRWRLTHRYAHIEKYAVIPDLAQGNWHRWSSANGQARASNYRGHELRAEVALPRGVSLILRTFFVKGIDREQADADTLETASRARIDLRYAF